MDYHHTQGKALMILFMNNKVKIINVNTKFSVLLLLTQLKVLFLIKNKISSFGLPEKLAIIQQIKLKVLL